MSSQVLSTPAIPILDTERLEMRGHRREDFEESAAMRADPVMVRHIGGKPSPREDSWRRLLGFVGHWSLFGYGFWIVREKASGRFVGEVGFGEFKRETEPACDPEIEIGWVLAPWAHGQGFATESVQAALRWSDETLDAERTICLISRENEASLRVADKCGYHEVGRVSYQGKPNILLARPRQSRG